MDENALLETWRSTRAADVADELQRRAPELAAVDELWRARSTGAGLAAFAAVKELDDPRLTVMLAKCLAAARWPGSGARSLWTAILAKLVTLGDARAVFTLRNAATNLPPFAGIGNRRELQALFEQAADELERACAGRVPGAPSPFFGGTSKGGSAQSLVEPVWGRPDDDAIKQVVADALVENGEPWGEFIALGLQLASKPKNAASLRKRADSLLNKHAQVFAGPIAFIATRERWVFEKGFLVEVSADRALVPRNRWDDAASARHWATVRHLRLRDDKAPKWWLAAVLKNPASANLRSVSVATVELARDERGAPWVIKRIGSHIGAAGWLTAFLRGLSEAERARLIIGTKVGPMGRAALEKSLRAAAKA